jgi:HK97 gp10 family phage protein
MSQTIKLDAKDLLKSLKKLPIKVQDKVIHKVVRSSANLIKNDAKKNAPVDTGMMKSKIGTRKASKINRKGGLVYIVNVKSPVHHLIELGTAERKVKVNILKFKTSSGNIIFISGEDCIIYEYIGYLKKIKSIMQKLKPKLKPRMN